MNLGAMNSFALASTPALSPVSAPARTWWKVTMSADHTKMLEMTCAAVVVRKSCWPSWESLWAAVSRARARDGGGEASLATVLGPRVPGAVREGKARVALLICREGEARGAAQEGRTEVSW